MIEKNKNSIYVLLCIVILTSFYIALLNEFFKFNSKTVKVENSFVSTNSELYIRNLYIDYDDKPDEEESISTYSNIYETEPQVVVAERIRQYKDYYLDTIPEFQKISYKNFIESIKNKENFQDKNSGWISLKDTNDKLIIGCSTVVWCGYTIHDTELEKYGYDIIGLGGAFDSDLKVFLENLNKKKYKRIVIFGGVNDVNLRAFTGEKVVDINYASEIGNLVDEARKHLLNGVTELVFVRVKNMTYGEGSYDIEYINRFNNCANQYNDLLTYLIGVEYYDIPFDTSEKYSAGYVHYDKKEVYKKIFDDLEGKNG